MKENIEEDIKRLEEISEYINYSMWRDDTNALRHILSDYKRVLKENEIYKKNSEIMSKENLSTAEQLKVEIKENFRLKNQLENNRKEYQETYKDVREELKELKKENETLKAFTKSIFDEDIEKEFIRVQKLKDKIEKLKINLANMQGEELLIYESKMDVF